MNLTDAGFASRFALAGGTRTWRVGTRAAFASLPALGDLLCKDRVDVGVRPVGHEAEPLSSAWSSSWRTSARVFSWANALEAMPADASGIMERLNT